MPLRIFPPLFNKYEGGEHFGTHVDNAIRAIPGTVQRIRTDLSCTVFFAEPDEYEGGELVIEGQYGAQAVKLAAGSMVLYPSTSLHHVTPVTRGARICSFFWMQSMIRDNERRSLLYDMDQSIQSLTAEKGIADENVIRLTGIYHNLIRQLPATTPMKILIIALPFQPTVSSITITMISPTVLAARYPAGSALMLIMVHLPALLPVAISAMLALPMAKQAMILLVRLIILLGG